MYSSPRRLDGIGLTDNSDPEKYFVEISSFHHVCSHGHLHLVAMTVKPAFTLTCPHHKIMQLNQKGCENYRPFLSRWRPSQKRRAAGHNRQHVISRRLRVLPTCPEWVRLSPGLPSPAEAGLWQLTQGSRYGSHHARSLETSWWIGNKNCQILRRTHSELCYM